MRKFESGFKMPRDPATLGNMVQNNVKLTDKPQCQGEQLVN